MIRVPSEDKKISIPGNSDLFGNIHYTKNINLDEEGYIKLAPRTVSLYNESENADLGLPLSFGRANGSVFNIVTSDRGFTIAMAKTAITVGEDSDASVPQHSTISHGRWYLNLWTVTDDDVDFFTKASASQSAVFTDRGTLSNTAPHPIEVFRSRNTLCIGDGNIVQQFNSSYADISLDLTLPADFHVIGLSYSNSQMGILTKLSSSAAGQNQDAYFFVWDGDSTSADQGIPTGADRCLAIAPYLGSWVILTRTGQLLYYTGGGFQVLVSLPFYFKDLQFGDSQNRDLIGDVMVTEGDVIYINMTGIFNDFGLKYQLYSPENPGGILCYDPKIGVYQRYSHSISPVSLVTVTSANINTSTDILTSTAGTVPSTGSPIKYVSNEVVGSRIAGLSPATVYYCIKLTSTTFKLATTRENAQAGTAVDITGTGDANNYFLALEVYDFGTTISNRTGGIAFFEDRNPVYEHVIFGNELQRYDATTDYFHINFVCPQFENRGYFVTPKVYSSEVLDQVQKLYIKHRLLKTGDKIIVKYKTKELEGLPLATPLVSTTNQCSWTGYNTFTTTADIADVKTAFAAGNDIECEVISGAGAGNMVKVSNITLSGSTYTVTLEENAIGAANGRYGNVLFDNWTKLGEITSSDTQGYKQFPLGKKSTWFKFKVELRGVDTTVEELQVINSTHKPSN